MEFKAKKRTLKVTDFDGQVYNVKFPSYGEIKDFYEKSKEGNDDSKVNIMTTLLVELGLPEEVQRSFDITDLQEIIQILTAQKKIQ